MVWIEGVYTTEDCAPFYYCGLFTEHLIFYFEMINGDKNMRHLYSLESFDAEEARKTKEWLSYREFKGHPFKISIEESMYSALRELLDNEGKIEISVEDPQVLPEKYSLFETLEKMIQNHVGIVSY